MAELTNILLESGTNELEMVEFYLDETLLPGDALHGAQPQHDVFDIPVPVVTRQPATAAIMA